MVVGSRRLLSGEEGEGCPESQDLPEVCAQGGPAVPATSTAGRGGRASSEPGAREQAPDSCLGRSSVNRRVFFIVRGNLLLRCFRCLVGTPCLSRSQHGGVHWSVTDAACARAGGCRRWRVPRMFSDPTADPRLGAGAGQRARAPLRSVCRVWSPLGSGIVPEQEHQQESCAVTARASWQGQGQSGPLTEEVWGACSVVDLLSPFYNKGKGNGDCRVSPE